MGQPYWILAVLLTFCSSCGTSSGTCLQKHAHNLNDAAPEEERKKEVQGIICSVQWWLGFVLLGILPLPVDGLAYSMASQSFLMPLSSMTLVLNQVWATCLLKEKLFRIQVISCAVIVSGAVITTIFGNHTARVYTLAQMIGLLLQPDFLISAGTFLCILGFVWVLTKKQPAAVEYFQPAFFALLAGGFGALGNIAFKMVAEMIKSATLNVGTNPFLTVRFYFTIIVAVVLASQQLSFLNKGMAKFDAVSYLPMYYALYILCGIIFGSIFYQEFLRMSTIQLVFFPIGCLITLSGVVLMTRRPGADEEPLVYYGKGTSMASSGFVSYGAIVEMDEMEP